jgi:hypothetical protein
MESGKVKMEIPILENGRTVKLMGMGFTLGLLEINTKVSGSNASSMDRALTSSQMATSSVVHILMVSHLERASTNGRTEASTLAILKMVSSMEKAGGKKVRANKFLFTKVITETTKKKALEYSGGPQEMFTRANSKMMSGMGREK